LVRAQEGQEAKYIIRGLQGKLRIGLAQSTVLISLAHAMCLSPPVPAEEGAAKASQEERLETAVTIVKKAYSEVPSFDAIIEALLRFPLEKLNEACSLRPGLPVEPMLAKPTKSLQEVLKRLSGQSFTCEFKYDGERAQVHMAENGVTKVGIFSF
jgi:DNA ligase-1